MAGYGLMRLNGLGRLKSDQRILGGSDFVNEVLSGSEENLSRKCRLKSQGYDFDTVLEKASLRFNLEKELIVGRGRQRERVRARDLLCFWCVRPLGMSMADLSKRLDMTLAAVSYAVKRGETIARNEGFQLED